MAYDSLSDFLEELRTRGELHRVSAPVSSRFEIVAISRQVSQQSSGGPALLFDQVDGQSVPVVTNLLGS
jgi:4-hydroxy-3-polyprenylbenzoate decarboxylase